MSQVPSGPASPISCRLKALVELVEDLSDCNIAYPAGPDRDACYLLRQDQYHDKIEACNSGGPV
jgi:hypothetical protein